MVYSIAEVMKKLDQELPSLSPTSGKVMQLANDIHCSPGELTKVIKLDPVLSVKVMRLVNSTYFSLPQKVTALEKAVIMVGLNTVKNLALSAALVSRLKPLAHGSPLDIAGFWKYSLAVGMASKMLALRMNVDRILSEDYFLAGMCHALGLMLECGFYPDEAEEMLVNAPDMGLNLAEEACFGGLNHRKIGTAVAEKWGLPESLRLVMENYESPFYDGAHAQMVKTVHLASRICRNHRIGLVIDKLPLAIDSMLWQTLGLEPAVEGEVVASMDDQIAKAMEFLRA